MATTSIRGSQILNNTVQRQDIDVSTSGQALTTKLVAGTNVTISSTGVDAGTGDVTISVPGGGVGPAGPTGPAGANGTVWWNGAGAPTPPPTGSNPGDYYLDTSSGDVWVL